MNPFTRSSTPSSSRVEDNPSIISLTGGLTLGAEKNFAWEIVHFDEIIKSEKMVNAENFDFTVEPMGQDHPSTKWQVYLAAESHTRPSQYWAPDKHVNIMVKLTTPPVKPACSSKLYATTSFVVKNLDGSDFVQSKGTDKFEISEYRQGRGFSLFKMRGVNIPLKSNGTLVIHIKITLYCQSKSRKRSCPHTFQAEAAKKALLKYGNLLESGEHSDVTITAKDGAEFRAHKSILAGQSPMFHAMFKSGLQECQTGVVKINDLSGKAIKFLLKFIYAGELLRYAINDEKSDDPCISEILYGATKYQLDFLIEHFDSTIGDLCDAKNAAFLLGLTNTFNLGRARGDVKKFLACNPTALNPVLDNYSN